MSKLARQELAYCMVFDSFFDSDIDDDWIELILDNRILLMNIFMLIGDDYVPRINDIFGAYKYCRSWNIKIVILGQDPYPQELDSGETKSIGASFSLRKYDKPTKSLRTIYSELERSIEGFKKPSHGDLTSWMEQGVLMINTAYTTRKGEPGTHLKHWDAYTSNVIEFIEERNPQVCYILWGNHAKGIKKGKKTKKLVSNHPAAFTGFVGNDHFVKANQYLKSIGSEIINWCSICE